MVFCVNVERYIEVVMAPSYLIQILQFSFWLAVKSSRFKIIFMERYAYISHS